MGARSAILRAILLNIFAEMTVLKLLDFEAWSEALNEFVPLR